jgi:electron transfer flavoprotein alpha subunit
MKMNSRSAVLPTCSQCGFEPVEVERPYAKDKSLCDVCCNKELKITWHVNSKTFHSRRDADAYRLANKTVKPAYPMMVFPTATPPALKVKKPIVVKAGKVVKQPCEWINRRTLNPVVIDLTKEMDAAVATKPPVIDIDIYSDNDSYVGLSGSESDDDHN